MSTQELAEQLMALPLAERVTLAQVLWESIDGGLGDAVDRGTIEEAARRDAELTSGAVAGRSHDEVMAAARRAIGCD